MGGGLLIIILYEGQVHLDPQLANHHHCKIRLFLMIFIGHTISARQANRFKIRKCTCGGYLRFKHSLSTHSYTVTTIMAIKANMHSLVKVYISVSIFSRQ